MLEKIISFCLKHKLLISMAVLFLVLLGVYSLQRLPIDAFPDVTNIQVQIISKAEGLSPLEVEKLVTFPIEVQLTGLPKLVELRSISKSALSVITVVFEDGVDIYFARQLVLERIIEAKGKVPAGVDISLAPITTALGEIFRYTLEFPNGKNDIQSLMELRTTQDWIVKPLLKSVPGVVDVSSMGGYVKQFHVLIEPEKLKKYNLTLQEVHSSIANNNSNAGGNILSLYSEQHIVRGVGLIRSQKDMENIVVKAHEGTPIFVRDVARVEVGYETRWGAGVKDGKGEIVGGIVLMLKGGNAREIVKKVKEKVIEINSSDLLPHSAKIKPYYDRTELVEKSLGTVKKALLEGVMLVIVLLYLFLRNLRSALVVSLALPLSALATFIMMRLLGISANLMSFGGLAISIGMIIDASIIQVENVQRHFAENHQSKSKFQTVLDSVLEVRKPSLFGELIIALTFLPILTLQGMEGKLFSPLAFTVILALLSSVALSIFVIPVLALILIKPTKHSPKEHKLFLKILYLKALNWCLGHKIITVSTAIIIFLVSLVLFVQLGTEFIPTLDEGSILPQVIRLPNISLEQSIEMENLVQKRIMQFPEVLTVVSNIGTSEIATDPMGQNVSDPVVILKPRKYWKTTRTKEELIEKMRESLEKVPGVAFNFTQPIAMRVDELISGVKSQVAVKLFGENIQMLSSTGEKIARELFRTEGATDIRVEPIEGQSYLTITIDRDKIARYGINVSDIQEIIEIAIGGKEATEVFEEEKRIAVVVRFPKNLRNSVRSIENILVNSSSGIPIPMGELVKIAWEENPAQVSHENTKRRIVVECNVEGRDIGSFVQEARKRIGKNIDLPSGYYLDWGGAFENQQRANRRLMIIMPLTILLVFFLLYTTFNSFKQAFLVVLNLPFSFIGGILAIYISGLYLSVPASVGFIALFGVAVLNGVVLVSYINQLRQKGLVLQEAILTGCEKRLRPVSMTALVTMLGLIPLIFATGVGSEIQKPLAVVVVGGLLTSTALTLFLLPVLYSWFEKEKGMKLK